MNMSWQGGNTRAVIQDLFGIHTHTVMLAATGMHVGKTTLSLGVFRGLQQKWGHGRVAYCKPLGQRYKDVLLPDGRTVKVHVCRVQPLYLYLIERARGRAAERESERAERTRDTEREETRGNLSENTYTRTNMHTHTHANRFCVCKLFACVCVWCV